MENRNARNINLAIFLALANVWVVSVKGFRIGTVPGASPLIGDVDIGCFADDQRDPDFTFAANEDTVAITPKKCQEMCQQRWFQYAALQNGDTCWCGTDYGKHGKKPDVECETKTCPNDPSQFCGGFLRNKVMESGYSLDKKEKIGKCWQHIKDDIVATKVYKGLKNSHSHCKSTCGAFNKKYAAVQAGTDCWCSDDFFSQGLNRKENCNNKCSGNKFEKCGTFHNMIILHSQKIESDIGLEFAVGCYRDRKLNSDSHVFTTDSQKYGFNSTTHMTRRYCQVGCSKLGFKLAGVTNGAQCWCGVDVDLKHYILNDDGYCYAPCSGDNFQTCGAPGFVYVMPSSSERM